MAHATFARILAPLAIAACAVALVLVITNTLNDAPASSSGSPPSVTTTKAPTGKGKRKHHHKARSTYTVKSGDILSTVAQRTGVSVERLQQLNPDVDPNALQVGQKLKLR